MAAYGIRSTGPSGYRDPKNDAILDAPLVMREFGQDL
jgi:hypothetical protein